LKRLEEYHAVVIDVRSYGLLVELPDVLVTGMVSVSSMTDDFYVFDAARMRFTGRRLKKTFQLGDKLKVSVARSMPISSRWIFSSLTVWGVDSLC